MKNWRSFARGGCLVLAGGVLGCSGKWVLDGVLSTNAASVESGLASVPMKLPGMTFPKGFDIKLSHNFVVCYNRRTRNPDWVMEYLTPDILGEPGSRPDFRDNLQFEMDETEHPMFRVLPRDYTRSGYDRGHMAAAANFKEHPLDCRRSFVMSNICPQVGPDFNRGIWNRLEMYTRSIVRRSEFVYVVTGPLYLPQPPSEASRGKRIVQYEVIGPSDVAVPTHFFKVLLVKPKPGSGPLSNHLTLLCFVMPNKSIPDGEAELQDFYVPLQDIERAAGFFIFSNMLGQLPLARNNAQKLA